MPRPNPAVLGKAAVCLTVNNTPTDRSCTPSCRLVSEGHRWEAIPKTLYEKDFLSVYDCGGECTVFFCFHKPSVSTTYYPVTRFPYWCPANTPLLGCVRLASLGRPRCVAIFFPGRTWVIIKKTPHTWVDPGELNERTLNIHA